MARLIRRALADELTTTDLSRYANAIMILSRIIEGGDLAAINERLDVGDDVPIVMVPLWAMPRPKGRARLSAKLPFIPA